jgi:hypothetical protein
MNDAMYDLPSNEGGTKEFTITAAYAEEKLQKSKISKLKVA